MRIFFFLIALILLPQITHSQNIPNYRIGDIIEMQESTNGSETIKIKVKNGDRGDELIITTESFKDTTSYKKNDRVIIATDYGAETPISYIYDHYRFSQLIILLIIFAIIVVIFGRKQGMRSLLGLFASILIIAFGMIPLLLKGYEPIIISIISACLISISTMYISHGLKKRTHIALGGMVITFTIATIFAFLSVEFTNLFGLGSEEARFLIGDSQTPLNLKGLLLGGMIIGILGVLDDITISQVSLIDELARANTQLTAKDLYTRGISVGRGHIASLVNTLALAYAGASLPLFLLFSINKYEPSWIIFNSEFIAEEIVRTIVGSVALIIAVPITTLLAVYIIKKYGSTNEDNKHLHCH